MKPANEMIKIEDGGHGLVSMRIVGAVADDTGTADLVVAMPWHIAEWLADRLTLMASEVADKETRRAPEVRVDVGGVVQ